MCSCDDGEAPRVFEQKLAKARATRAGKLQWCCECRRDIQLDEWHEDASGFWESWGRYRTCLRCVARRAAWRIIDECTPPFGQLAECILEPMLTQRWLGWNASGRGVYVKHIDRELGRIYMRELRAARVALRETIARVEAQRIERRQAAARARWCKRAPTHLGEGI